MATQKPKLDANAFPILSEWLEQPNAKFREHVDSLAGEARREASAPVQRALKRAVELLPELYKTHGGQS